jgi:hypothetical protein
LRETLYQWIGGRESLEGYNFFSWRYRNCFGGAGGSRSVAKLLVTTRKLFPSTDLAVFIYDKPYI